MDTYFLSFDGRDRNIAKLVLDSLRRQNPQYRFFWTGDSLTGGKGWFEPIQKHLEISKGIICLITNSSSGTNNWLNFEVGAAIGGKKHRIIIMGDDSNAPTSLSKPLQGLQCIKWSDTEAIKRAFEEAKLTATEEAISEIKAAMEPPIIVRCRYGEGKNWYEYTPMERGIFMVEFKRNNQTVIGNHLIGENDPSVGNPKVLVLEIERDGKKYSKKFKEQATVTWGKLW